MANETPATPLEESSRRVSRACATTTIAIGLLVIAGWAFNVPMLTRVSSGYADMAANTAFAFVLLGIALWPLSGRVPPRRADAVGIAAGGVVAALGALTLIEYATASNLGFDELLFKDLSHAVETAARGRMAVATAVNVTLLGVAATLLAARRAHRAAQALCLFPCAFSLLALAGHLYGVRALYSMSAFTGIAIHTVLTTLVVGGGLIAADRGHGVNAVLTSETLGGTMVRRILPWSLGIPLVVGWLVRKGRVAELYPSEFGASLLVVSSIVLIGTVVLWQGAALGRIDRDRLGATRAATLAAETLRKLSRAVEQSPASVVITDTKGDIEYVNPKFTRMTGFSSDEVLGMNPRFLKSGALPAEVYRELWETITAGREWRGEFHNRKKSGEPYWELASVSPIFDEQRHITNFVAVNEDITEKKRAEEDLRFQNLLLATLSEVAPDGILVVDANARIVRYNQRFRQIIGIREEQVIEGDDAPLLKAVTEQTADPVAFLARVRHLYEHPEETARELISFRDGRTFERYSAPMAGPDGAYYGRVWYFRDVTESRALEEQLRQSQKMEAVGRLAGGIAHDFNNLLTVITGYTELAAERLGPDDPSRAELSEIERAAQRAADLTRQLLAFSRKQVLQPRVISLNHVVTDTENMLRRLIGEDVELRTSLTEPLGSVKADAGQIVQVLLNLAVNSRDAMPKGGKLTIETSELKLDAIGSALHAEVPPGRYVLLSVRDTGSGMDASTLSHVFEPFFTTKETGKGTGLGLSTVYGIVKQSGGHVTVSSEPGAGTAFRIYLPRVDDAAETARKTPAHAREAGGSEVVLVVEDEEGVRKLICTSLDARGYVTLPASSGAAALLVCERHAGGIDLMLTDVVMPKLSGPDLARRAAVLRPRMKVLFMSGYIDDAIMRNGGLDAGTAFLQKPFTTGALAKKIREVLDEGSATE